MNERPPTCVHFRQAFCSEPWRFAVMKLDVWFLSVCIISLALHHTRTVGFVEQQTHKLLLRILTYNFIHFTMKLKTLNSDRITRSASTAAQRQSVQRRRRPHVQQQRRLTRPRLQRLRRGLPRLHHGSLRSCGCWRRQSSSSLW